MNTYERMDNREPQPQLIPYGYNPYLSEDTLSSVRMINPDPTEAETTLNNFEIKNGEIFNRNEILLYLENNADLVKQLKDAAAHIPKIVNYPFKFHLKLAKDMEDKGFVTLYLCLVGKFTAKQAFNLLQEVDKKWTNQKVSDVSRFNVNVEFI